MIKEINQALLEAVNEHDLTIMKVDAVVEAALRELQINYSSAELKVLQESGTADDLAYLYEAANNGLVETIIKAIQKIKEAIEKFFSEMKDKILTLINKKESKEAIDAVEKKVKIFPLLGKKKVMVENYNEEYKSAQKHLSLLNKIKAKLKSGQDVDPEEIEKVEKSFIDEHGKFVGVAAAVTITVTAALALIKKMSSDAASVIKRNESDAKAACDDAMELAKKIDKPQLAQKLANAISSIAKTIQQDFMRCLSGVIAKVKEAIKSMKNTKIDAGQALEATEMGEDGAADAAGDNAEAEKAAADAVKDAKTEDCDEDDPIDALVPGVEDDPWNDVIGDLSDVCGDDDSEEVPTEPEEEPVADPEPIDGDGNAEECGSNCGSKCENSEDTFESVYAELFGDILEENAKTDEEVTESAFDALLKDMENLI